MCLDLEFPGGHWLPLAPSGRHPTHPRRSLASHLPLPPLPPHPLPFVDGLAIYPDLLGGCIARNIVSSTVEQEFLALPRPAVLSNVAAFG